MEVTRVKREAISQGIIIGKLNLSNPDLKLIHQWIDLRNTLIDCEQLDEFRHEQAFKWAIQVVVRVIDDLTEIRSTLHQDHQRATINALSDLLLGESGTKSQPKCL